ncbi:GAF domain-containing protein [Aureimonas leprariae]|uniref:GAF domain-containing protein n=1 Tax=Plantimonas leprariae TaxID=2615207 RepID=A0A7V7TXX5_9HYPH|nr:GAF domain-containing protein [Aureimonas leprariae]KAB0681486.1 GAF domain-containing protein [Aureimonas leprariae]
MFAPATIEARSKPELYRELALQLRGLVEDERDPVANMANASALLWGALPDLNWAGFYVLRSVGELVVGPFQGKPACTRIPVGRGVCGTAVAEARSIVVEDVHSFPGHIACDAASRSELVVPVRAEGRIVGVIDLDSPVPARFDAEDRDGIERIAAILGDACDWAPPAR